MNKKWWMSYAILSFLRYMYKNDLSLVERCKCNAHKYCWKITNLFKNLCVAEKAYLLQSILLSSVNVDQEVHYIWLVLLSSSKAAEGNMRLSG